MGVLGTTCLPFQRLPPPFGGPSNSSLHISQISPREQPRLAPLLHREQHFHRLKIADEMIEPYHSGLPIRPHHPRARQQAQDHRTDMSIDPILALHRAHTGMALRLMRLESICDGAVAAGYDGSAGNTLAVVVEGHVEVGVGGVKGVEIGRGWGLGVAEMIGG